MRKAAKAFLFVFFAVFVLLPLLRMFLTMGDVDVAALLTSRKFAMALRNSLESALVSSVLSVGLSLLLAHCAHRTRMRGKALFSAVFAAPMLMPSLSHGMGLIVLFGANGLITRLLPMDVNIYGFGGIVAGSVMYSFPVAFLMLSGALRFEDGAPHEAAEALGLSGARRFFALTLPYMRKPLLSVFFAVFTMIITDYGVPLMIGGQYTTLPIMMYQDVIGLLDFGKGSVIGSVLLVPAFAAFLLDLLNQDRGNETFVLQPFRVRGRKRLDRAAFALCLVVGVLVVLPIATFALLTFVTKYPVNMNWTLANIEKAFGMNAGQYLRNSLWIALGTALCGTVAATASGYLSARTPGKSSRALHLASIVTLAVPGLVLGLSYALTFTGSFLYGTLAILILVNVAHFFASPYLMAYNAFGKINPNLEAVGATLGLSRARVIAGVILPQAKATIADMFVYFFVNAMMTISAVSFLAGVHTKPVSLMIPMFEAHMLLECAAFVSLLLFFINATIKGLASLYTNRVKV